MTVKLQLALDFVDLHRAVLVAEKAVPAGVDWLEVGTPLIKSEGLDAVRELKKRFPGKTIVADMKIMDAGRVEVESAAKAGAGIIDVLGTAGDATIEECVQAGKNYGAHIVVDLIAVPDPVARAERAEELGADYITVHVAIDEQMRGQDPFAVLAQVAQAVKVPVGVAGGINSETAAQAVAHGASYVIGGGAITKAKDPEAATREIRQACSRRPPGLVQQRVHYRWNPEVYAGAGYGVVTIDFHGSTGYGQAFTDSISGDWAGKPLEDLQKGLAAALERYSWLDGGRACALGASYGGYMMNWIAGRWPERLRCLVNHAGMVDSRSMYYTTEELWFPEWDLGGPYFASPESHERWNPAQFVTAWRAPMLVIHGALDFRVPYSQGLGTFTALQRRGIDSRFLFFPDENHWILKPANSLQWHAEVLAWLERHLKN